jgi:hypothetical protein
MRALVLWFGIASCLLAQQANTPRPTPNEPAGKFYGPLGQQPSPSQLSLTAPRLKNLSGVLPSPAPPACAVPLQEMAIANGTTYTMPQIAPPKDAAADRATVKPPLPPCPVKK